MSGGGHGAPAERLHLARTPRDVRHEDEDRYERPEERIQTALVRHSLNEHNSRDDEQQRPDHEDIDERARADVRRASPYQHLLLSRRHPPARALCPFAVIKHHKDLRLQDVGKGLPEWLV